MTTDLTPVSPESFDVAVVGAGPTGLVTSILLAQRGHRVVLLDRYPDPYPLPRAVHFDHEVGRILQACGVGPEVRGIIEPADFYEWRNGEGVPLLRFGISGDAPSGWPSMPSTNAKCIAKGSSRHNKNAQSCFRARLPSPR